MTNSSGRFLKGLMLGSSLIGLGYYLSKNKELSDQISTKVKDGLNVLSENSHVVQDKLMHVVSDTKSSLNHVVSDTKTSLTESVDKTSKQFMDTVNRLTAAFNAGRIAARENLQKSKSESVVSSNISTLKDSGESPLGATEDTRPENSSTLHPGSNNIAKQVGDAGTNFDKTASGKPVSEHFGSDKYTGI